MHSVYNDETLVRSACIRNRVAFKVFRFSLFLIPIVCVTAVTERRNTERYNAARLDSQSSITPDFNPDAPQDRLEGRRS